MAASPTILVIDDNDQVVKSLAMILSRSGYHIAAAASGLEGLEKAMQLRPTLIITDVEMPGMKGTEVVQHLRAAEATRHTPVIIITGYDISVAKDAGADAVLNKPFNNEQLLSVVKMLIQRPRSCAAKPA
jgi:CheY-like chemotaxis protein